MNSNELHDVFISYRRFEDEAQTNPQGLVLARAIYSYLSAKGLKVFWDKQEMRTGQFEEQLNWQLEHSPNYIFIATENAKRFRTTEKDYVADELHTALALYDAAPNDRVVLPVFPFMTREEAANARAKGAYPDDIQRVSKFHGVNFSAAQPAFEELDEILKYVTRINRGNMWNAGYRWLKRAKAPGSRFAGLQVNSALFPQAREHQSIRFPVTVQSAGGAERSLIDTIRDNKGNLYLIGPGGIGKTTALMRIMEEAYEPGDSGRLERNQLMGQVPLFVELSRAPDVLPQTSEGKNWQVYKQGKSTFIHREIFRQVRRDLRLRQIHESSLGQIDEVYNIDPGFAVKPIIDLFTGAGTPEEATPEYILLLDGLNEISRREILCRDENGELEFKRTVVSMVIDEIHSIMRYKNVRVILTSRTREATNWTELATLFDLTGIKPDTVRAYLAERHVSAERREAAANVPQLKETLCIPLFLIMYAELAGNEVLLSAGEIMRLFFHQKTEGLYTQKARMDAVYTGVMESSEGREPASRLKPEMMGFVMDFILPEIAWRMVKAREHKIRRDQLGTGFEGLDAIIEYVLTGTEPHNVCGRYGAYVFGNYASESCADTAEFADDMINRLGGLKKAVNAIRYCMQYTLGVLYEHEGEYGFTHHHLRDFFSAMQQINLLKLAVYLQKRQQYDIVRKCLNDWIAHPLPIMTRKFIGEALGEMHNVPVCDDNGDWHYSVPEQPCERNLIKRVLDLYRGRFDGEYGHSVWNLLQVLKDVRQDLSGEDFSGLDLSNCEFNGHTLGRRACCADFHGAKMVDACFMHKGHAAAIQCVNFDRYGTRFITASADGIAKVWDVETMQEIGTLEGHSDVVQCAAFSPDGARIVTASMDCTARIWDAKTFQEIGILKGHTMPVQSACYSPDGTRIVTASGDNTARIWDALTLNEIGMLMEESEQINTLWITGKWVLCASYSPDGSRIVTGHGDCKARIWNAQTGKCLGSLEDQSAVNSARYDPKGTHIVTASDYSGGGAPKVWDAETLQQVGILADDSKEKPLSERGMGRLIQSFSDGRVFCASYSPDGTHIITGHSDGIRIWDAQTMHTIGTIKRESPVCSVSYSPDGTRVAANSNDGTAVFWDAETLQETGKMVGHPGGVLFAKYDPKGTRILTISDEGTANIWDVETSRTIGMAKRFTTGACAVSFSSDGTRIVASSSSGTARVWDAETLMETGALKGEDSAHSVCCSPDGARIVTTSGRAVCIWDAKTMQKIATLTIHRSIVPWACYSPDGMYILTVSSDCSMKVWDAESLRELDMSCDISPLACYAGYSPDGARIVTASRDMYTAEVWDAKTLQKIGKLQGRSKAVRVANYSPDGACIVALSDSPDNEAEVWDARTLQAIGALKGHSENVQYADYSPDGARIITASQDGTVKIWDSRTLGCLETIPCIPGLEVTGVDLRRLGTDSRLSDDAKNLLYKYGAVIDVR